MKLATTWILPEWSKGKTVVEPEQKGDGWWAGAPSVAAQGDEIFLAYRLRRPVAEGRGYANVVARSRDGLKFEQVARLEASKFGTESLERPALVVTPEGKWRLYVSVATPGSKHWRVDMVEAETPDGLAQAPARTVLPGDDQWGVKDPVVLWAEGRWHLWASCHPLDVKGHEDRMVTMYATSQDGVDWIWEGTVLEGRPGKWDARGVRVTAVAVGPDTVTAYYDGRANADENWYERTGVAVGSWETTRSGRRIGKFTAEGEDPAVVSPHSPHTFRYVTFIDLPDGNRRFYYEAAREDGSHELRTELVPAR